MELRLLLCLLYHHDNQYFYYYWRSRPVFSFPSIPLPPPLSVLRLQQTKPSSPMTLLTRCVYYVVQRARVTKIHTHIDDETQPEFVVHEGPPAFSTSFCSCSLPHPPTIHRNTILSSTSSSSSSCVGRLGIYVNICSKQATVTIQIDDSSVLWVLHNSSSLGKLFCFQQVSVALCRYWFYHPKSQETILGPETNATPIQRGLV